MRIKLSKSDWRLVGNKMGWLKRAQVAGNPTLPAAPAAPVPGKAKVAPKALPNQSNNNSSLPVKFTPRQLGVLNSIKTQNDFLVKNFISNKNPDWLGLATGKNAAIMSYTDLVGANAPQPKPPSAENAQAEIYSLSPRLKDANSEARNSSESPEQRGAYLKEFETAYGMLSQTQDLVLARFMQWWQQWLAEGNQDKHLDKYNKFNT